MPSRRQSERNLTVQYAVTRILAESDSLAEAGPRTLEAVCESLGWDVGALWLVETRANLLRCRHIWHAPSIRAEAFEAASYAMSFPAGVGLPGRVWMSAQPVWLGDVLEDDNFPRVAIAAQVGLRGAFAVPILRGAAVLGVIEFFSREVRAPDAGLLAVMAAIGSQVGLFIERTQAEAERRQLLVLEQGARAEAEQARARSTFLAGAGALLASSLDYHNTLAQIADLVVPDLADWCILDVMEEGEFRRLAVVHADPAKCAQARYLQTAYPPDPKAAAGVGRVLRTGKAELYEKISDELAMATARNNPELLALLRELGLESYVIVPLIARGRTIGAITLVSASAARRFRAEDLTLVEELARRAGLAVENARLYREAEVARERSVFLAEASRVMASSLDYYATLRSLARLVVPYLADWCIVYMQEPDGHVRRLEVAHADPAKADLAHALGERDVPDIRKLTPSVNILLTGRAQLFSDVPPLLLEAIARDPAHLAVLRALGVRSAMIVPLVARERILGALLLLTAESGRRYSAESLQFAEDLAGRAALAVDNARLYREARDAVQAREEFLSIASHELKSPITALQLQTQILLRFARAGALADVPPERMEDVLTNTEQQLKRLNRLVNDLLDVSRIAAGRLELQRETVDVAAIVHDVLKRFGEELNLTATPLEVDARNAVWAYCDRFRVDQVVTNLLSNAIKYGEGKPIRVGVETVDSRARIRIQDEGIGISEADLERIFTRYERAAPARRFSGLGLGLYIVRQIVEAHGGSIKVTSQPGAGSTFVVDLPQEV